MLLFTVPLFIYFFQFRNQYDSDVTVWSPQGRLHQVEYAMEAVKLGSATVGLKNKTHAVIIALKRATSELSAYQKKVVPIDKHIGITVTGLTADARILRYNLTIFYFHLKKKRVLIWKIFFTANTWEPSVWTTSIHTTISCLLDVW